MDELYSVWIGDYISHEGVAHDENPPGRGSGRYGYGTGERPHQHLDWATKAGMEIKELQKQGLSMKQIAAALETSQAELRRRLSVDKEAREVRDRNELIRLRDVEGVTSLREMSRKTGIPLSTVRNLLQESTQAKIEKNAKYMEILRKQIEEKGHIDVGAGTEHNLGVSSTKMSQLVKSLQEEGYVLSHPKVPQAGTSYDTNMLVLSKKDTPKGYIYNHIDEIKSLDDLHVVDDGTGPKEAKFHDPRSIDSSRVMVLYNEEGGLAKDGLVELRRGVQDLNLGNSNYAQVRIAVDGTHYIKGMAVYADDLPPGVDVRFNTNKHEGTPMMGPKDNTVFKPIKGEGLQAFGATIRDQNDWTDDKGVKHEGLVNIVKEEGVWHEQQRTLASQFLSKQSPQLAKKQLDLAYADRAAEFEEIKALTNPVVKQRMLRSFAEECDAAAVHLKAAAIPRQSWNVIIPMTTLKPGEIYAPGYKDGEEVVCVRYPHGGTFELVQLKVNNRNKEGKRVLGGAFDAVGIGKEAADKLSGADFDGDTVLVIPNPKRPTKNGKFKYDIQVRDVLEGLKDFEPKEIYKGVKDKDRMTSQNTQRQMGIISNLITDMTAQRAPDDEMARAVRHSMVVIDAEKHGLDYKRSYKDNKIAELKKKYQQGGGVATLLSRAKSPRYVNARVTNNPYTIDENTGERIWNEQKPKTYIDKDGVERTIKPRQVKTYWMDSVSDARELISDKGTVIESVYAKFANDCKALANEARKEYIRSSKNEKLEYDKEAAKTYAKEVEELNRKLLTAQKNAPKERAAQRLANLRVKDQVESAKLNGNELTDGEVRKLLAKQIEPARREVGAKKQRVTFTEKEWEAVQHGAIHQSTLAKLLSNADEKNYKTLATPRNQRGLSQYKINRIKGMLAAGGDARTMQWIADYMGVSLSTIANVKSGKYDK